MRSLEMFAMDAIERVRPFLKPEDIQLLEDDFRCGEEEVALISALDAAPHLITAQDVEDLKRLMKDFYSVDKLLAQHVLDKALTA